MKLIIMPESTRLKKRSGVIRKFLGENSKQKSYPIVQFQAQAVSRKTKVKMEKSLHSSCKYILWSSNTEN